MCMCHKLCYTTAISGACPLLSPLGSSCVQGLPFHSPVYNILYHACVQVCTCTYVMEVIRIKLALLHFHRDIDINIAEVIDEFARRLPHRLQLANILT